MSSKVSYIRSGTVCSTFRGRGRKKYILRRMGKTGVVAEIVRGLRKDVGSIVWISYVELYENYFDLPACLELPIEAFKHIYKPAVYLVKSED